MEWVKTTAKTLPEAIDLALDNLGVDESEAEIVVLEEPRQGLFGRMRGTARVEARVKPKAIRPKTERNRNRKGKGGEGRSRGGDRNKNRSKSRSGGLGGNRSGGGRAQGGGGRTSESQTDDDRSNAARGEGGGRSEGARGEGGGRKSSGQGGRARSGGGGNDGGRNRSADTGNRSDRSNRRSNNNDEAKPKEETPVDEVAEHLQTFLSGLTEAFGFDSAVTVDSSEADVLVGRIEGQHGLLVGPKGRTLDAVQELARISCQRTVPSSIRIKVDVGGYRQQRQEALAAFAKKAADTAVETDAEVALEPMSAADRKAIHDALSEDGRVETRSVGTDPRRKVLVVPVEEPEHATADSNGSADAADDADDVVDEVDEADEQDELVASSEEE